MKALKSYLLSGLIFSLMIAHAQAPRVSHTLNSIQAPSVYDYQARDYVDMIAGFRITPGAGTYLTARINEKINTGAGKISPDPAAVVDRPGLNTTYNVGSMSGSASVSLLGQAVYSIPVFTSPGTNGMVPQVALQYVSQQETGVAGYGWDLTGLSSIIRAAPNHYYDGQTQAITYTNADAFVMDGQRLLTVAGTNGSNGAVYATEAESFNRVTSYGVSGNGPSWFEVKTKSGNIIEYGNTADSRLENGTTVFVWKINKITDANGNYMLFSYTKEANESVIDKIAYTGNAAQGIEPYNSIEFFYDRRPDARVKYLGGKQLDHSFLLRKIKSVSEGKTARVYELTYAQQLYTRLIEVVESSAYGGERYNSTLVAWENDIATASVQHLPLRSMLASGDANGDGITDLVVYDGSSIRLILSDGLSTSEYNICPYSPGIAPPKVSMANVDGNDNKDEIYVRYPMSVFNFRFDKYVYTPGAVEKDIINTNAFSASVFSFIDFANINEDYADITPMEIDGDGLQEFALVRNYKGSSWIEKMVSQGAVDFYAGLPVPVKARKNNQRITFIDLNGNSKTDVLLIDSLGNNYVYEGSNTGAYTLKYSTSLIKFKDQDHWGDFNGDGNTDLLLTKEVSGYQYPAYLYLSDGLRFSGSMDVSFLNARISANLGTYSLTVNDFNADAKSDVVFNASSGSTALEVYYSNGKDFHFNRTISVPDAVNVKNWFFSDLNGDGKCDAYGITLNGSVYASAVFRFNYNASNTGGNSVSQVVNGLNLVTRFDYVKLTEGRALANYTARPYLFMSSYYGVFNTPQIVVKNLYSHAYNLCANYNRIEYNYENAVYHKGGKGFLGFTSITRYHSFNANHLYTEYEAFGYNTAYHVMYPAISSKWVTKALHGPSVIFPDHYFSRRTQTYEFKPMGPPGSKRFWLKPVMVTDEDALNNLVETVTYNLWDEDYGNLLKATTQKGDMSAESEYTYIQAGSFCPDKIGTQAVTMKKTGAPDITRISWFDYDASGNLVSRMDDPFTPKGVTTTYSYSSNQCGLPASKTIAASGIDPRTEFYAYDPAYRFVTAQVNTSGQSSSFIHDPKTGNILSETGVDGLTTSYQYNALGLLLRSTNALGISTTYTTAWNPEASCSSLYYSHVHTDGSPDSWEYYDRIGRVMQERHTNPSGPVIFTDINYYADGSLKGRSKPRYEEQTSTDAVINHYDAFGRVIKVSDMGRETTYGFDAAARKVTKKIKGSGGVVINESSVTNDHSGLVSKITDPAGDILYTYNSAGQITATGSLGNVSTITYDQYGMQKTLNDPGTGITTYDYNALGQLVYLEDARGSSQAMQYDVAGRLVRVTEQPGNRTTVYSYINTGNGINQLQQVTTSDAITRAFQYDRYGRIIVSTDIVDAEQLSTSYAYNSLGQLSTITCPSGYQLTHAYNSRGYLSGIRDPQHNPIWQAGTHDVMGQPLRAGLINNMELEFEYDDYFMPVSKSMNNGGVSFPGQTGSIMKYEYGFDPYKGNLQYRTDVMKGFTELFQYDNLDRLITANPNAQPVPLTISYHPNGNIRNKNDVSASDYEYKGTPYAVTHIPKPFAVIPTMQQDVAYTNSNLVQTVTEGNNSIRFYYGYDQQRMKTELSYNDSVVKTKYYSQNYEKEITSSGTRELHYIHTPVGLTAVMIRQNGVNELYYTYTDHLGSILALVNTSGQVVEEYSYDAWGRRRNAANWNDPGTVAGPFMISRGYTGHEHHDEFGVINMNARIYDPVVGRVMSADKLVQDPSATQSFNRYSYAWNNPLKYTDPDGNFVFLPVAIMLGAGIGAITGSEIAISKGARGIRFAAYMLGGAAVGAASGYAGSGVGASGIPMANTAAIATGSFINSVGTAMYSGGQTDVSIGFGVASYNLNKNEWGYLGKKGNSTLENIGYGLGALANVSDVLAGFKPGSVELRTENDVNSPTKPGGSKDLIGHSQITDGQGNSLVDWGPGRNHPVYKNAPFKSVPGTNAFEQGGLIPAYKMKWNPVIIDGVNTSRISGWNPTGMYNLVFNSCVSQTSRALNASGAFNIGIHPHLLHLQMYLRSIGLRPTLYSHFLTR